MSINDPTPDSWLNKEFDPERYQVHSTYEYQGDDPDNNFARGGIVSGGYVDNNYAWPNPQHYQWPYYPYQWPTYTYSWPPKPKLVKTVEFYEDGELVKKELYYE